MATLETAAHLNTKKGLPLNRYLIEIEVPDDVWNARYILAGTSAPAGWDAIPAGHPSIQFGSQWYNRGDHFIPEVPPAIVPEESCTIINCRHPEAASLTCRLIRKFTYDGLLGR